MGSLLALSLIAVTAAMAGLALFCMGFWFGRSSVVRGGPTAAAPVASAPASLHGTQPARTTPSPLTLPTSAAAVAAIPEALTEWVEIARLVENELRTSAAAIAAGPPHQLVMRPGESLVEADGRKLTRQELGTLTDKPVTAFVNRAARHAFPVTRLLAPLQGGRVPRLEDYRPVQCINLSASGIGWWTECEPQYELCIVLLNESLQSPLRMLVKIIRKPECAMDGKPGYFIGGRFLKRLPAQFTASDLASYITRQTW